MHNKIYGLIFKQELPSFYIIVNPVDIYSPILKFMGGCDFNSDQMLSNNML